MDPGQLGGHRDHVDGAVAAVVGHLHPQRRPRRRVDDAGQLLDGGALLVGQLGRARPPRRSPAGRRWRDFLPPGTPRPLTRKVRPDGVPAGTRRVTLPSRVGTVRVVPSAASAKADRDGQGQVAALAAEDAVPADPGDRRRGRRRARRPGPAAPRPLTRIRAPSSTPAGRRTLTERLRCSTPVPEHVGQGWVTMVPRPAALRADLAEGEHPLVVLERPGAAAAGAGVGPGARGGARPRAGVAPGVGGHVDRGGHPADGVLEGEVQFGLDVAAALGAGLAAAAGRGRRGRRTGRRGRRCPRPGRCRRHRRRSRRGTRPRRTRRPPGPWCGPRRTPCACRRHRGRRRRPRSP